jgi:hypothetical protein
MSNFSITLPWCNANNSAMFLYSANDVTSKCYYTSVISFLLNGFITLPRRGLCDKYFFFKVKDGKLEMCP